MFHFSKLNLLMGFFGFLTLSFVVIAPGFAHPPMAKPACDFLKAGQVPRQFDSAFFSVLNDKVLEATGDRIGSLEDVASAHAYIETLAQSLNCKLTRKEFLSEECQRIAPFKTDSGEAVPNSGRAVCVLRHEMGEFILSANWVDHVNIIFNRWD